ncbi:MAG TPA: hypothetical protein VLH09_13210 [Bryobacteraceae bacterium]|nr:hypothetical protein [Bryobacteraceae bacterium]
MSPRSCTLPFISLLILLALPLGGEQAPARQGGRVDIPNPVQAARWRERMRLVEERRRQPAGTQW